MAREKFKIETQQDFWSARNWIINKLEGFGFPYSNIDDAPIKNLEAKEEFKEKDNAPEDINTWCETYLNKKQWNRLKNAIRAGRLRQSRKLNYSNSIRRVDLTPRAHIILKKLSESHDMTYSDLIVHYMEKELFKQK